MKYISTSTLLLLKSIGQNLIVKGMAVPLSFLSGVMLARFMGVENYGLYGLLLSIATVCCSGIVRSISVLLVRELAGAMALKKSAEMIGIITMIFLLLIVAISLAASIIGIMPMFNIATPQSLLIIIGLMLILSMVGSLLRGFKHTASGLFVEQAARPLFLILAIIYVVNGNWSSATVSFEQGVDVLVIALFCAILLGAVLLLKAWPEDLFKNGLKIDSSWLMKSLPLLLVMGYSQGVSVQLPILMMGSMVEPAVIGNFRVADTMAGLISLTLIAANVALGPRIAALKAKNDLQGFEHLLRVAASVIFCVAIPMALVFILFGESLIPLIFGQEYMQAAGYLSVLCFAQVINSFCGPVMLALNMLGGEKENIKAIALSLIITFVLGWFLINAYGGLGAAWAKMAGLAAWNFYLVWSLFKNKNILCLPYIWKKNVSK
ncbi:polysaccharide biosynthesis C-terminal domain-containing protein [Pseudomonadales bacterium]|nr:polysaccharide biosynthesis C-terminal domain-containing protein [Pseudomonadales bacterium]